MLSGTSVGRCALVAALTYSVSAFGQNYERYRPQTIAPVAPSTPTLQSAPEAVSGSDKELLKSLDAVIVYDDADAVQPQESNEDAAGLILNFPDRSSLVHSAAFRSIVQKHIGQPVSLRSLNQLSRDIILLYRKNKQPVVDVVIPEQKITGGTVQIVVTESKIARVVVKGGCYFDPGMVGKWVECTRSGTRIYEPWIENDLFWLNQNPFRKVGVDLKPGSADGTTDVFYEVTDVMPVRGYIGYDDTGVQTLGRERLSAGFIYGNAFGNDGLLSYQYTADGDMRLLNAHALTYSQPIDRDHSFLMFGSWAGVNPSLGGPLTQTGESWQVGMALTQHLCKNQWVDENVSLGVDFKTTNNNLEFGGQNVQASSADLVQLRLGYSKLKRRSCDQYERIRGDIFVGPGAGFSSGHNATAFNTIRTGTSPDYVYARLNYEEAVNIDEGNSWQLQVRTTGQVASERLLFSETLGLGGFDTVRGYDQRTLNGDHGWLTSLELGPRPSSICVRGQQGRLRYYSFIDMGHAFIADRVAGDPANQFLYSAGVGMQMSIGQDLSLRLDYGYGFEDVAGLPNDRLHLGFVWQFGPRP